MIGVTLFGIYFTPVLYYVVRWFTRASARVRAHATAAALDGHGVDGPPRADAAVPGLSRRCGRCVTLGC
jgi:hypothetical protein